MNTNYPHDILPESMVRKLDAEEHAMNRRSILQTIVTSIVMAGTKFYGIKELPQSEERSWSGECELILYAYVPAFDVDGELKIREIRTVHRGKIHGCTLYPLPDLIVDDGTGITVVVES